MAVCYAVLGDRAQLYSQPAPHTLHLRGLSKPAASKPRQGGGGAMRYFNRAAGAWRRGRSGDDDDDPPSVAAATAAHSLCGRPNDLAI